MIFHSNMARKRTHADELRTEHVSALLRPSVHTQLKKEAKQKDMTVSTLLDAIVDAYYTK